MNINIVKWVGTIGILCMAFLTSINVYPLNITVGLFATVVLAYVAIKANDKPYLMLNLAILLMNASALWKIYI